MKYTIGQTGDEVTIDLSGTAGRTPQVLEALHKCQEGRCACPTDQYERLAGMDIATTDDEIRVTLRPREGATLDTDAVRLCVEYTVQQAETEV
jgi:hypothetical protein